MHSIPFHSIHSFIHSLIHSFTHSLTHSFIHSFHSFTHSFIHSFISFISFHFISFHFISFIHVVMGSFIHWFIASLLHWFTVSLIQWFIRSVVHGFFHVILLASQRPFAHRCTSQLQHFIASASQTNPVGHWFLIAVPFFWNFRPGMGRAVYLVSVSYIKHPKTLE